MVYISLLHLWFSLFWFESFVETDEKKKKKIYLKLSAFSFRYCNQYVDKEALLYLMLANEMLHELHPEIITIAEDVSGDDTLSP